MDFWFAAVLLAAGLVAAVHAARTTRRSPAEPGRVQVSLLVADRGETVEALVRGMLDLLTAYGGPEAELVVTDAGSRDETAAIVRRLANDYPGRLKVSPPAPR